MAPTALQVANTIIDESLSSGRLVDQLKIQKLLYLAQGVSLAALGKPLFSDAIEAWRYGPVVPAVYQASKAYGRENIETPLSTDSGATPRRLRTDGKEAEVIAYVLETYGDYSGVQLVALTHSNSLPEGRPWAETFYSDSPYANLEIPQYLMHESFKELVV